MTSPNPNVPDSVVYRRLSVPPLALVIAGTVLAVVVLGCVTILAYAGKDATELRSLINTVLNFASVALGGGTLLYAGSANQKASKAVEQTNGALDQRIREAVANAVATTIPLDSASVQAASTSDSPARDAFDIYREEGTP